MDWVSVVEACYDVDQPSDAAWLEGICLRIMDEVGSSGVVSWDYHQPLKKSIKPGTIVFVGDVRGASATMIRGLLPTIPSRLARDLSMIPAMLGSEAKFPGSGALWRLLHAAGIGDTLVLNARDPSERGVYIGAWLDGPQALVPRDRQLWRKISAHIATAQRLRRRLRDAAAPTEAVIRPNGAIDHAEGEARDDEERAALSDAVLARERARGRMRKDHPNQAVTEWRGMIAARWTLVDHFESDGQRFLLARRNDVSVGGVRGLSPREMQAVAFASLGHTNKVIAYEMGIAASTVAVLLSRAASKVGARTRHELLSAYFQAQGTTT